VYLEPIGGKQELCAEGSEDEFEVGMDIESMGAMQAQASNGSSLFVGEIDDDLPHIAHCLLNQSGLASGQKINRSHSHAHRTRQQNTRQQNTPLTRTQSEQRHNDA